MTDILRNPADHINNAILPALMTLKGQLGELDEIEQEIARARSNLDSAKRNLEMMKGEVREAEHFRKQYLDEARASLAEKERLDKEIKQMREEASQLNEWRNKMLQQLQR